MIMNKLYIINWQLPNGYRISTSYYWTENDAREKMNDSPGWAFTLTEDNDVHKIWTAK